MKAREVIAETIAGQRLARIEAGLANALPKAITVPDDDADAILAALAREGLAVVPVEATGEMEVAGGEAQQQSIGSWGEPGVVYRAMIAAARKETDHEG